MNLWQVFTLIFAGVFGGLANAMAGGASLFTFPALLAVGLPPIVANASNALAVTSSNGVGFLSDLKKLPKADVPFWLSLAVAVVGGGLGAALLLVTPENTFTKSVPALIGIATLLFAFSKQIQRFLSRLLGGGHDHARLRQILLFPVAIYGGYFGAGAGVIILSALSATSSMELRSLNALKNLIAFLMNVTAIIIFIHYGLIEWPHTLVMMIGTLAGGFAGIKLTKVLPQSVVRNVIVTCGVLMTAIYVWRYWL